MKLQYTLSNNLGSSYFIEVVSVVVGDEDPVALEGPIWAHPEACVASCKPFPESPAMDKALCPSAPLIFRNFFEKDPGITVTETWVGVTQQQ